MNYTGACNALSMQRAAALKTCNKRIAAIAVKGADEGIDALDQHELVELATRASGLRRLLDGGCPA